MTGKCPSSKIVQKEVCKFQAVLPLQSFSKQRYFSNRKQWFSLMYKFFIFTAEPGMGKTSSMAVLAMRWAVGKCGE